MKYLLDTNIVSEWKKPRPETKVISWLDGLDEESLFLSEIVMAELRRGAEKLAEGARRKAIEIFIEDELPERFEGRILGVDRAVADAWGRLMARSEAAGRRMSAMDCFQAAIAECHEMILVTRNSSDFLSYDGEIVNPWD